MGEIENRDIGKMAMWCSEIGLGWEWRKSVLHNSIRWQQ